MQILSSEQKQILIDCGHDWKNDSINDLPIFYIKENRWACNCSQGYAENQIGGLDLSNHDSDCILKIHFSVRQIEQII